MIHGSNKARGMDIEPNAEGMFCHQKIESFHVSPWLVV